MNLLPERTFQAASPPSGHAVAHGLPGGVLRRDATEEAGEQLRKLPGLRGGVDTNERALLAGLRGDVDRLDKGIGVAGEAGLRGKGIRECDT